jgi:2-dehydro-3-deoxyphosphogluconate aldolase/(4S)-4-hydroxy-2-oxoglutarate aldolase
MAELSATVEAVKSLAPLRIIPVLTVHTLESVPALAEALIEFGIGNVEVTLRTSLSMEGLKKFAQYSQLTVGVGSVKKTDDLVRAIDAGAQFAVSPGFSESVGATAKKHNITYLPGVATPTEIMAALDCGFNLLKFFPAEKLGGLSMLKSLAPVFPEVSFIPTGGIDSKNAQEYLNLSCVVAVGGSWMLPSGDQGHESAVIKNVMSEAIKNFLPSQKKN